MEKELIGIIENNNCDFMRIRKLTELLVDLYVFNDEVLSEYELRDKYRTSQTLIDTLFELIWYKEKESNEKLDNMFQNLKNIKDERS